MKKFTLLALVAMFVLPSVVKAESWTKEVSTKSEFTAAMDAIGDGVAGETYEIVLTNDVADIINTGTYKPYIYTGRIVIRSDKTDFDEMPILQTCFDWQVEPTEGSYGEQLSLIFENVNLQYRAYNSSSSGQVIYFNGKTAPLDTVAFRNCHITNIARCLYRSVAATDSVNGDPDNGYYVIATVDWLEMSNCRVYDNNISSGNNWFTIYTAQFLNTLTITDNLIYDIPYSKGIWGISRVSDVGATPSVTFDNNSVFVGANKTLATQGFNCLSPGSSMGYGMQVNINNNIFIGPQEGTRILVNDTCGYDGSTTILNGSNGCIVWASNNVIDSETWTVWDPESEYEDGDWAYYEVTNDLTPEDVGITSWEAGEVFQNPANSYYYMLKSSTAYTAGVDGTYLGAANMYVDEFPVVANVDIAIDGPSYISYTISPEAAEYYVGDEITISFDDYNSYYRTFNVFSGWSDGNTDNPRTITLEGDLALTATFAEAQPFIAVYDFSGVTGSDVTTYDADLYYNLDETYQGTVRSIVNDTANATGDGTYEYVEGSFQTRTAKFSEDDEEIQMPIISRRTAAVAKEVQRNYAQFEFCTTGFSGISFSCYVGTDNNGAILQAAEYSLDGSTWTRFATVELQETVVWHELVGTLPSECDDQALVYVRVIGDISEGHITNPNTTELFEDDGVTESESAYLSTDAFEYIGQVLVSYTTSSAIQEVFTDEQSTSDANAPVYNLMGIQVDKSTKGILIQNGKKFVNK